MRGKTKTSPDIFAGQTKKGLNLAIALIEEARKENKRILPDGSISRKDIEHWKKNSEETSRYSDLQNEHRIMLKNPTLQRDLEEVRDEFCSKLAQSPLGLKPDDQKLGNPR